MACRLYSEAKELGSALQAQLEAVKAVAAAAAAAQQQSQSHVQHRHALSQGSLGHDGFQGPSSTRQSPEEAVLLRRRLEESERQLAEAEARASESLRQLEAAKQRQQEAQRLADEANRCGTALGKSIVHCVLYHPCGWFNQPEL